jgi:flagellar biosynthesis/type III secretory pathway protein FliH
MSWSDRRPRPGAVVPREQVEVTAAVSTAAYVREVVAAGTVEHLLDEARREAEAIRQQAVAERDALLAEARRQGEEEGRRVGYAAGYEAGEAEGLRRMAEAAETVLDHVRRDVATMREAAVDDLARLALAVASRLYRQQIEQDPDHVAELVRELLAIASPHRVHVVEVNPLDLPAVLRARAAWRTAEPTWSDMRVVPAPDLGRGALRLLTDGGWLERDWEAGLDDLRRLLITAASEERDENPA